MPVAAATLLMGATVALLALPSCRPVGMPHCRRLDGSGVVLRGAPAATMRAGGSPDIAPTSAGPSAAKQTATPEMLRLGAVRAAGVGFGSLAVLALLLPGAPDFWQAAEGATLLPPAPLLTLGGMLCIVVAGWSAFGTEMHPITAKARGLVPLPGYSFQILGLSAVVLSSASVALSWYPLPFAAATPAGSLPLELTHCVVPVALWQADAWLLRYLNPHVEWAPDSTSLSSNYRAEHGASLLGAALALLGVAWFEVYVQQMIAVPLTLAGWPLLASAGVIALNAGLLNHALANGLLNGIACAEFYWTVSLLFSLSGSALPVGIYHHLMYSMPILVQSYDRAVESDPSPPRRAAMLHSTLAAANLAAVASCRVLLPTAIELQPALPTGIIFPPGTPTAAFGAGCLALFLLNVAGVVAGALNGGAGGTAQASSPADTNDA